MNGERRRARDRRAIPTTDARAVSVSVLRRGDRRPRAVGLRVEVGGLAIDVALSPDAPALLQLAEDIVTAA